MGPEKLPDQQAAAADGIDGQIEECYGRIRAILLGSGSPTALQVRREVARLLSPQVFIMEDFPDQKGERFEEKWSRILRAKQPSLYAFVIPKEGKTTGLHWELRDLQLRLPRESFREHVCFYLEVGMDPSTAMSGYSEEVMEEVGCTFYKSADQLARRLRRRLENLAFRMATGTR